MSKKRSPRVWCLPDALWERMAPLLPKYRVGREDRSTAPGPRLAKSSTSVSTKVMIRLMLANS